MAVMDSPCEYVNVFQGCGAIDLPEPAGVAASWHFIKALCGNTGPGAVLPFGKLSCCPYSGGYSSGYGSHMLNCGGKIPRLTDGNKIKGISHLNHSGTGAVGFYYNYAVTTPFYGSLENTKRLCDLSDEHGVPGYYTATFKPDNIKAELTVSDKCACHRYAFSKESGRISVDFSNNGLYDDPKVRGVSKMSTLIVLSDREACAEVTMQGVKLYFYVLCKSGVKCSLWQNHDEILSDTLTLPECGDRFGCVFELSASLSAEIRLSVSAVSMKTAINDVHSETRSFDLIRTSAYEQWNKALSRIEIETENESDKEIFYSNLYHTLVKPTCWDNDSFVYKDGDFVVDLCTLWDMYKTQLPLVFTLYPDISSKIVNTYIHFGETKGFLPHTLLLSDQFHIEAKQACMLAEHMLTDAYLRKIKCLGTDRLLNVIERDMKCGDYDSFYKTGLLEKSTKTLDMAEASQSVAMIAKAEGRTDFEKRLIPLHTNWQNAFDKNTGLLTEHSDYYEGNLWNYSFRLLHDMESRIALAGGSEHFTALLDRFFGFTDSDDTSGRFEGFNNETDMETPYAYHYVNRHDRLSEIIDASLKYMFVSGRGGIPGNNDSGGLSSCYIWNVTGLFPVSGQDLMIIGSPHMNKTVFHLSNGKDFTIRRNGAGIYVKDAYLNGTALDSLSISVNEMMNGGELAVSMSETP